MVKIGLVYAYLVLDLTIAVSLRANRRELERAYLLNIDAYLCLVIIVVSIVRGIHLISLYCILINNVSFLLLA